MHSCKYSMNEWINLRTTSTNTLGCKSVILVPLQSWLECYRIGNTFDLKCIGKVFVTPYYEWFWTGKSSTHIHCFYFFTDVFLDISTYNVHQCVSIHEFMPVNHRVNTKMCNCQELCKVKCFKNGKFGELFFITKIVQSLIVVAFSGLHNQF